MAGQPGLFDLDERYAALSAGGDLLERLAAEVEVELLRGELDAALDRSDRARGGRPPCYSGSSTDCAGGAFNALKRST
jgi:IS5 family transposase